METTIAFAARFLFSVEYVIYFLRLGSGSAFDGRPSACLWRVGRDLGTLDTLQYGGCVRWRVRSIAALLRWTNSVGLLICNKGVDVREKYKSQTVTSVFKYPQRSQSRSLGYLHMRIPENSFEWLGIRKLFERFELRTLSKLCVID